MEGQDRKEDEDHVEQEGQSVNELSILINF